MENKIFPVGSERPITLASPLASPKRDIRIDTPTSVFDFSAKPPLPAVNRIQRVEYKRTLSAKVHDPEERVKLGHRRTQSYSAAQQSFSPYKNDLTKMPYNRSSSNIANTREYYAAPAYNEASLLERKVSMRNSQREKSVVQSVFTFPSN